PLACEDPPSLFALSVTGWDAFISILLHGKRANERTNERHRKPGADVSRGRRRRQAGAVAHERVRAGPGLPVSFVVRSAPAPSLRRIDTLSELAGFTGHLIGPACAAPR
ncbi:hypothetical protein, partial [Burkholderia ubonensis]|uniref:hypothetical protein n=1 Tax=Burkholderia ubonensis TaxID=101571 RepID=UPI001E58290D